jgi:ubiquinone/menaquinone biosynthesis C-methylase UbiE
MGHKFDARKLERLNDPDRLIDIPPAYIWERLDVGKCRVAIDLGAGTGLFSRAFLDLMPGGIIYAADISEQMLNWMRSNVSTDNPGIIPVLVEESRLPLESSAADVALAINLYHELDAPAETLREVLRVLRPGGTFCIVDWKKQKTDHGPPVEHRFTAEHIAEALSRAGYTDVNTDLSLRSHSMVWARKR